MRCSQKFESGSLDSSSLINALNSEECDWIKLKTLDKCLRSAIAEREYSKSLNLFA